MKLIFLVGPTGIGKSAAALALAKDFQWPIVNADSIQLYQELRIGSARPTEGDLRITPHHLFGEFSIQNRLTAGDYARKAKERLEELAKRQIKTAVVVGGTGFYLQALEGGMPEIPAANPDVQKQLWDTLTKPQGESQLYRQLQEKDPVTARQISPQDHYRLVRAMEVVLVTGKSLSQWLEEHKNSPAHRLPYTLEKVGLSCSREELRVRIQARAQKMLADGFVDEVRELLRVYPENHWVFQAVGYKQVWQFLTTSEVVSQEQLCVQIVQAHMQLAKKQMTWFRHRGNVNWIHSAESEDPGEWFGEQLRQTLLPK